MGATLEGKNLLLQGQCNSLVQLMALFEENLGKIIKKFWWSGHKLGGIFGYFPTEELRKGSNYRQGMLCYNYS